MYLTSKNKENFEKWFTSDARFFAISCIAPRSNYNDAVLAAFEQMPFEMQIGVYLAYYESINMNITLEQLDMQHWFSYKICFSTNFYTTKYSSNFQIQTYKVAFKKADEIINEFLK